MTGTGKFPYIRAPKSEDYREKGLWRAVVVIVVKKKLQNKLYGVRKGMLLKDPVSESTGIVTENVPQVQLRKIQIIGPQQNKKRRRQRKQKYIQKMYSDQMFKERKTGVRTVQNRRIENS